MAGAFTAIVFFFGPPDKRQEKRVMAEAASSQPIMYLIVLIWKDKSRKREGKIQANVSTNGVFFSKFGEHTPPTEVSALLSPMGFPLKTDNYKMKIIAVKKFA